MSNHLQEFRDALADGNYARALDASGPMMDEIGDEMERQESLLEAAEYVLGDPTSTDEERAQANQVIEEVSASEDTILELTTVVEDIVMDQVDSTEAVETVDRKESSRQSVEESAESLRSTQSLQALGSLVSLRPEKNVTIPRTIDSRAHVRAINSGGTATESLTVTLDTLLPEATPNPSTLDQIESGSEETVDVTFGADVPANVYTVKVTADDSSSESVRTSFDVQVADEFYYLYNVRPKLDSLYDTFDAHSETLSYDRYYLTRLNEVRDSVDTIISLYEDGEGSNSEETYADIYEDIDTVKTVLNYESGLPDGTLEHLTQEVESVEDTLVIAEDAELCYLHRASQALLELRNHLIPMEGTGGEVDTIEGLREDIETLSRDIVRGAEGLSTDFSRIDRALSYSLVRHAYYNPAIQGEDMDMVRETETDVSLYLDIAEHDYL